jgi:signal transduction histidine kinase
LTLRKTIKVITEYAPSVRMWARGGELWQVFTNLILNALEVLPEGGTLRVRTAQLRNGIVCVTIAD